MREDSLTVGETRVHDKQKRAGDGAVHALVVADVEKSFKDAADFTQKWIDERVKA